MKLENVLSLSLLVPPLNQYGRQVINLRQLPTPPRSVAEQVADGEQRASALRGLSMFSVPETAGNAAVKRAFDRTIFSGLPGYHALASTKHLFLQKVNPPRCPGTSVPIFGPKSLIRGEGGGVAGGLIDREPETRRWYPTGVCKKKPGAD